MRQSQKDASYKMLFRSPRMVRDLICGFVPDLGLQNLSLETMRRLPGDFVSDRLKQRHSDLVYQIRCQGGVGSIYLVIEFQSTPDPIMALRTWVYSGLLLQQVLGELGADMHAPWPPVVCVVVYTGDRPWRGGVSLGRRFWRAPSGLLRRPPQHRFVLIDSQRHVTDNMETLDNLVGIMLHFERVRSTADFARLISRLHALLPPGDALRRTWIVWISNLIRNNGPMDFDLSEVQTLTEMTMNLAQRFKQWEKEYRTEGLNEGLKIGRQEGRQEGLYASLRMFIDKRFGPIPADVAQKLQGADAKQLNQWLLNALDAPTLADVFKAPH